MVSARPGAVGSAGANRSRPMTPSESTCEPGSLLGVLRRNRVVPVVTIREPADAIPLATALVDGGLTAIEITLRTPAGLEAIHAAVGVPGAVVGAGTVSTGEQAEAALDAGARFIVSPGLVEGVLEACGRRGALALPGIATPTEMLRALALGCRVVKVFPASILGGPAMIRALAALGTGVEFVPTGGIDIASAPAYLSVPEVIAVGGSWMVPAAKVAAAQWPDIRNLANACSALRTTDQY
jgi:2-dehydro-3-deoxyphosphogluconate aldolase/(4S)-4-hydroxy-2-oxoglutarate aldolase